MADQTFRFLFWQLPTYQTLVTVSIISSMFYFVLSIRRQIVISIARLVDLCLAMLAAGLLFGRAAHVLLHWSYFAENREEILQLAAGGLDWHGAVLGAILAASIFMLIWRPKPRFTLDSLALALPFIGFMAWWGCGTAVCSYGERVNSMADYPSIMAWEAPGEFGLVAPRFATQRLGMLFSAGVLLIWWISNRRNLFTGRRLWIVLALYATSMLWLDGLRGDYAVTLGGARLDQWLDALYALCAIIMVSVKTVISNRMTP